MANLSGTNLAAPVVPFTTEDTYPTHMAAYGKGGWRSVEDLDELYTIPTSRLEYGCVAYVKGEDKPYIYKDGNWSALDLGGGSEEGSEIVVDSELSLTSTNPIQNQAVANALVGKAEQSAVESLQTAVGSKADKVAKQEVSGDQTISPNTMYVWGSVAGVLTITKGADIAGIVNNYMVRFTAGEGCAVNFLGFTLQWYGGDEPTWTIGNAYEISIVDNIALWAEFEPTV